MMATTGTTQLRLQASIDHSSPIPYYVQIKNVLRDLIEHGEWKPGDLLPGEPELCHIFGVSRTVVRQALQELSYEGLLVRERGRGTFVAEPKISESLLQRLTGFYQDMADRGHPPVTQVLKQEIVAAGPKIAAYLQVEPGAPLIQLDRLRFVKGEPIVLVSTFLPHFLCPQVMHADFTRQSLYMFLERECGLFIVRGRRFIEAVTANEYEARLLNVPKGAPLLKLESVSYLEGGKPIEYYYAFHRADRSRFEAELVRVKEPTKPTESVVLPRSNDLKDA
ncbi:GntR family transcriptional regulator [Caldilinea sp.]|jgi:GntR family transcriptional regulator|uniref:GntR family transcriptional regulator n=1 Tax=Caldilinea sp. TaxID=2293560 RepID=UPI0021DF3B18|nr:GntR family transcriptional regulator [Caldilinea sp.]GIV72665.1 MAG: GntR family transcriptional regulator [Caldilinea sp.]